MQSFTLDDIVYFEDVVYGKCTECLWRRWRWERERIKGNGAIATEYRENITSDHWNTILPLQHFYLQLSRLLHATYTVDPTNTKGKRIITQEELHSYVEICIAWAECRKPGVNANVYFIKLGGESGARVKCAYIPLPSLRFKYE